MVGDESRPCRLVMLGFSVRYFEGLSGYTFGINMLVESFVPRRFALWKPRSHVV